LLGAPVAALVLVIGALQALVGRAADENHHGVPA
jgi:hypothetical protein